MNINSASRASCALGLAAAIMSWHGNASANCSVPGINCVFIESPSGETRAGFDIESSGSSFAWKDWFFKGVDNLFAQSWWYQTPGNGEVYLGAFLTSSVVAANTLTLEFEVPDALGNRLFVGNLSYTVTDSGNVSTVAEALTISNLGNDPLDLTFFVYTDFDLLGTAAGDTAFVDDATNPTAITQVKGGIQATVSVSGDVLPSAWEIAEWRGLLDQLDRDTLPTTLANLTSPLTSADTTHAFQFDFGVAAGGSTVVNVTKSVTLLAEPHSVLAFGIGLAVLASGLFAPVGRRIAVTG